MKKKVAQYAYRFFAVVGVLAMGLGIWMYLTYPKAGDIAASDLDT